MQRFLKNACSAIAIAFGGAVLVGGDYRAYASQEQEPDYDNVFLEAVQKVFTINKNGSLWIKRKDGTLGGIGVGSILWFLDTHTKQIIMLYSKQQQQNAQALAEHIKETTKKDVRVYSLVEALRIDENWSEKSLYELFKCAGQTLFGEGDSLFAGFKFTLFNYQNYTQYCQNIIGNWSLYVAIQGNRDIRQLQPDTEGGKIFINYLSHIEPIFLVLVNRGIFKPDAKVGVYSILNPCNSCKLLFDTTTQLKCNNCFIGANADRIVFRYLGIDGQHRKKKRSKWSVTWHTWYLTTMYNWIYRYGRNDIVDKQK